MTARRGRTAVDKGMPRRRAKPVWRWRLVRLGLAAVVGAGVLGGGWWLVDSGRLAHAADALRWQLIALTAKSGLTIQEVLVTGRRQSTRDGILEAVNLARGAPTLAFDPHDAKQRIEALPWVRRASVLRLLPDTILIRLEERSALAIWQSEERFRLIDETGEVIAIDSLEPFADLVVVVGEDAPDHASDLLRVLGTQADLRRRVRAAVRVGGRRWNLRLDNDIDVRLPEADAADAWARLAEYQQTHDILSRDVRVLDLRLPDRLIVRRDPGAVDPHRDGQDT